MTNQPNIKREILDFVIGEVAAGRQPVSLRRFAEEHNYSEDRVARHSNELYPALNHGVSSMLPMLWDMDEILRRYESWDAEPPDELSQIPWPAE